MGTETGSTVRKLGGRARENLRRMIVERKTLDQEIETLKDQRADLNSRILEAAFAPGTERGTRLIGPWRVTRTAPIQRCGVQDLLDAGVDAEIIAGSMKSVYRTPLAKAGVRTRILDRCISNPDAAPSLRIYDTERAAEKQEPANEAEAAAAA